MRGRIDIICERCHKIFSKPRSLAAGRKFCSQNCSLAQQRDVACSKRICFICDNPTCKIEFSKPPSCVKNDIRKSHFCSWKCFQATQPSKITLTCKNVVCAKQFVVNASAAYYMYCSKLCRNTCSESGNVKWYSYFDKNGKAHRIQGGWELAYASYLDNAGVKFETHPCALYYDDGGKKHVYFPDFKVHDDLGERYVDVKNDWLLSSSKTQNKLERVRTQNPTITLITLDQRELIALGITLPKSEEQRIALCYKHTFIGEIEIKT